MVNLILISYNIIYTKDYFGGKHEQNAKGYNHQFNLFIDSCGNI